MTKINGTGYDEHTLKLCIDSTENGAVRGYVVSMRLSSPMAFGDLSDFVVKMDAVMDEQNFPQAFQRKRMFRFGARRRHAEARAAIDGEAMSRERVARERGGLATIDVRVLTRQNASWQGSVVLDGRDDPVDFESSLELMQIISRHLGGDL